MRDTQRPGPQVLVCLSRCYYLAKIRAEGPGLLSRWYCLAKTKAASLGLTESMLLFG